MNDLYTGDWRNAPKDARGIPLALGSTNPPENFHLTKLKYVHDTTNLTANECRDIAISYALSNFQIRNHIPREQPTVLRRPAALSKKSRPRGVLRARSRYPFPYHIGPQTNVKETIAFRTVLLSLLRNTHAKKPFTNQQLASIKDTILFYTPKQLFIAHKYAKKVLGSHNIPGISKSAPDIAAVGANNQDQAIPLQKSKRQKLSRKSVRHKSSMTSNKNDEEEFANLGLEQLVEKQHQLLIEIGKWTSWTNENDLRIADIKIGNLIDFFDVGTGTWYQARALKETRRGVIMHLIWPAKEENNQVLLQKEHLTTLVKPLFTHSNYLLNETFLKDVPSYEKVIATTQVGVHATSPTSLSQSRNGLHRLYVKSSANAVTAPKRINNNRGTAGSVRPISSALVGKEVMLGASYNVQRKYLGKRAIVLGSAQSSGGWVDICIVNADGTEGDHLRWRLQGLLSLTGNQRNVSKRNLIAHVIRKYYNNEEQANKLLLDL